MQWSEVLKPPSPKMLRQFAGLWLVVFGGLAAWRAWNGQVDGWTQAIGAAALVVGLLGLVAPAAVRPIFTGWMIVAFPIGWTVSRIALGGMFYGVFTPVATLFRLTGRDVLHLRRGRPASYWVPKQTAKSGEEYLRQF